MPCGRGTILSSTTKSRGMTWQSTRGMLIDFDASISGRVFALISRASDNDTTPRELTSGCDRPPRRHRRLDLKAGHHFGSSTAFFTASTA